MYPKAINQRKINFTDTGLSHHKELKFCLRQSKSKKKATMHYCHKYTTCIEITAVFFDIFTFTKFPNWSI